MLMSVDEVKIVVVDDDEESAQALATLLSLDGYTVLTVHDGAQAILLIEQFQPHCVLLDIGMPGIDGYELATILRQRYKDDIILIAVTGADTQTARVANTFAVVDHYFQKPLAAATLRRLLPPLARTGST
jgi:two-component system, OmpR family, response regulator